MTKFKVGDKVRCVDNIDSIGKLSTCVDYTVLGVRERTPCIRVDNGSSFVFDEDRFELVTEPKTNQWQVYDDVPPRHSSCEYHTMPNGVVMWRIPDSVIADDSMGFQPNHDGYDWDSGIYRTLKGKTKDGKPFGTWTVDFGGE